MPTQLKQTEIELLLEQVALEGTLTIPVAATSLILFAHGSGSSRFSRRNQFVAETLNQAGLGTLLFDLLSLDESILDQQTAHLRFNIELLSGRVVETIDWAEREESTQSLRIGLFGASTGAAAALVAAAERPDRVGAVVSRGGRPDLAGTALERTRAPTLLIVGGNDQPVISLNEVAMQRLPAEHQLVIIPGATHLFEEPGALEQVAELASAWFQKHLVD